MPFYLTSSLGGVSQVPRKGVKVLGLIVVLVVVASVFSSVVSAENVSEDLVISVAEEGASGNKDDIISDVEYRDYQSLSLAEIQSFWGSGNSYLATYQTTDYWGVQRSAAEIIYNAAQNNQINPEVILTTLQKEQTLITTSGQPTSGQLDWAMGYGVGNDNYRGFGKQVEAAAWQFDHYWTAYLDLGNPTPSGWGVGITKVTDDGVSVTPQNKATASFYTYTPYAGYQWGGNNPSWGGNYLFWNHYHNTFGFADGVGQKFNIGDWVQVTSDYVNVRDDHYTTGNQIWQNGAPKGSLGVVLEGPQSGNGYTWWKVRYDYAPPTTGYEYWKPSVIGWSAEASATEEYLGKYSTPTAPQKFLTLPFKDSSIKIQQGWVYTWIPDDPNAHKGIDYIKGTIDSSSSWQSFDVVAAADGVAMYSTSEGYGTFVLIRHNEKDYLGNNYFTLYAHLQSVASGIPLKDEYDVNYGSWKPLNRGDFLGRAGNTGASWTGIHLHFEAERKAYAHYKTDPYDLYKDRSYYPGGGSYTGSGSRYLWTTDPPSLPSLPDTTYPTVDAFNVTPDSVTLGTLLPFPILSQIQVALD